MSSSLKKTVSGIAFGCFAATSANAAHDVDHRESLSDGVPLYRFDLGPDTDHVLYGHVTYGLEAEVEFEAEHNFDLERGDGREEGTFEPSLTATISYDPSPHFRAAAEVELSRKYEIYDTHDHDDFDLSIEQAYVTFREFVPGATVQIGRVEYEDERDWLLDQELDGIRAVYRWDTYAVEAAVTREELLPVDVFDPDTDERINNYYLGATTTIGDDSQATAYALYRDDLSPTGEDLLFTGVQSHGEIYDDTEYWLEAAIVTGDDDGRDVLGYAVDTGITYVFEDAPWEPSVTVGFAYGSGDDGSGTDGAFRQSGLHGNSARWNGVTSLNYYGEVLDPELSNLGIVTAGVGVRPTKRSSVDIVYHYYFQPEPTDEFRDIAFDPDPTGRSGDVGHEIDLVLGYREFENVDIEFAGGVFFPGAAFDDDDPAFFVGATIEFKL